MNLGLSITETCDVLKLGLKSKNVEVSIVSFVNNSTIKVEFVAKASGSVDLKSEVGFVMSFVFGFLRDGDEFDPAVDYIGAEAMQSNGKILMHAISPLEAVSFIAAGKPIEWLHKSIFQDHSDEFVQSVAKRYVSQLENGMRMLIAKTLSDLQGSNWWASCVGNKVRTSTEDMFEKQEGFRSTDGNQLIYFTFLLDLRKIVVSNWSDFDPIFKNQARFTDLLERLNVIRRAEAHNRTLSGSQMAELESVHNELMNQIASVMPDACSNYLVENWRIQLRRIFESNIEAHEQNAAPLAGDINAATRAVKAQINRYEDLLIRASGIVIPPGKNELHAELLGGLDGVKQTLVEMLVSAPSGDIQKLERLQRRNAEANLRLQKFQETYLKSEL